MDNNILLETTVKTFENGIDEVKNLKSSLVKLSTVIKDLLDFNEIFTLDIDAIKVDEVRNNIDDIILEQKKLSNQYRDSINELKKSHGNDLDKLTKGMNGFLIEAENMSDKLKNISQSINVNKIEDISKQADEYLESIRNQYTELGLEFKKITDLGDGIENLKKTVEEVNEKVKSEDIEEKVSSAQAVITEFQFNYHKLNEKYGKLNEDIYNNGSKNIEDLIESIGKLYNTADEFHNKLISLDKNLEIKDLENKCKSTNVMIKKIYEDIELDYIEDVRKNRDATKSIENRMASLEEKIIFLIDENQNLKKLYSQKSNVDNEFQNKILAVIKENLKSTSNIGNNNYDEENTADKHKLAIHYLKRYDDNKDLKKAIELFEISSKQGNDESTFNIAEIYYYGRGIDQNFKLALQYYLKAANNGHNKSADKIIEIYESKSNNGEVEYSRLLGDTYLQGKIVNKDIQKAIKWYEISVERGSKDTVNILIKLYELLASKNDVNAKLRLGEIYYTDQWGNKDNFKAFKWYLSAEEQGYSEAKNKVGQVACDIGDGMFYSDVNQSIEWYKIAAEKGNAEAQYKLGDLYHKGKFITKDEERAVTYYQMAANQGHLLALTQIKIVKPFSKFFK